MAELTVDNIRKASKTTMECTTTAELEPLEEIVGQKRAVKALKFGVGINERGFNIYVSGIPGTGKTTAVRNLLSEVAAKKEVPSDWCYVHNFHDSYRPVALELPAGKAVQLSRDMKYFIDEVGRALPRAFESEEYVNKREATVKSVQERSREILSRLGHEAEKEGFVIQSSRIGLFLVPVIGGKPVTDQEVLSLPTQVRAEIESKREKLNDAVRSSLRQVRELEKAAEEAVNKLNHGVALFAIDNHVNELLEKYGSLPETKQYIESVKEDVIDHFEQFLEPPQDKRQPAFPFMKEIPLRKYDVNVIVDNSSLKGAPVVIETSPTYPNLLGKSEREAMFGTLSTDFTMIRGGAIHRANGGYIVMPVQELLRDIMSYQGLKKALQNSFVRIEEPAESLGYISTKGLKPEPIPLKVKVILIGDPYIYQQLYSLDPEFTELFKVKADFDTSIDRNEENLATYAALVCTLCRKENLKHLDKSAMDKLVEHSARMAEHQDKLSTRFSEIANILREANFYASEEGSDYISGDHIRKTIEEKDYRSNLIQEKIREMIDRGFILIDTQGKVVGQVNGLTVMGLGDFSFGSPSRLTASVGLGKEGLIDIQRESKLGGPIHTKGVLILSGYLTEKYALDKPLSLSARLVFEQSYGMVEGDSASSTELYALLSSLSGIPIKQNFAVTGSVNQKGEVQAIGGVNEKIEGFYEVCKAKGMEQDQSVMIPESNVQNLMLKEEVVEAVKSGKFHIYSVRTIDEGIALLTGVEAGQRGSDGSFEKGTINYLVDKRLRDMAQEMMAYSESASDRKREE